MTFRKIFLVFAWFCLHCKSAQSKEPAKPAAMLESSPRAECSCPPAPQAQKPVCPAPPAVEKPVCPPLPGQEKPVCPVVTTVEKACPETGAEKQLPEFKIKSGAPFANLYEEKIFFDRMAFEHQKYGKPVHIKRAKKKKFRGAFIEQRSGRKRLYDHNLFLRRLFTGQLALREHGKLSDQFEGAVFLDIGSAILSEEGAVTVRDLFEDKKVAPHLTLVASDINDKSSAKHRYIDIYRKQKKQLPFDVVEISPLMTDPAKFTEPLDTYLAEAGRSVMLRAANSGPDLYYDAKQLRKHLLAAIEAFEERSLIYFFNKFILYKPKAGNYFILAGEIDETVGTNHKETTWEDIDWSKRKFEEGIFLNQAYW